MPENGIIVQVEGLALDRNMDNSSMITDRKTKLLGEDAGKWDVMVGLYGSCLLKSTSKAIIWEWG